jgi:hypothetical protein
LDNKRIICAGTKTLNIVTIDLTAETYEVKCIPSGHSGPPRFGQVTMDENYFISSNLRESIVWDIKTMEPLLNEGFRFVGLYGRNRVC